MKIQNNERNKNKNKKNKKKKTTYFQLPQMPVDTRELAVETEVPCKQIKQIQSDVPRVGCVNFFQQ